MENNPRKTQVMPFLALLKKQVQSALESVFQNSTLQVRVSNEKVVFSYFNKMSMQLEKMTQAISNMPKIEFKDTPASINIQSMSKDTIKNLTDQIAELKGVMKESKAIFPKLQQIYGQVQVSNQKEFPINQLINKLTDLQRAFTSIRLIVPPYPDIKEREIKFPPYPTQISMKESASILDSLQEIKDVLSELPNNMPEAVIPKSIIVSNFPPTKTPMPVTNISINSLRGFVKTRSVTITTGLTPLPGEVLNNRRSVIVYNNSAVTIEVGGSDFAFGDGLPIPTATFSPPIDCGDNMILYGRVSIGTANVRTLEVSDDETGK